MPAALNWLMEDTRHANVVVRDSASITGARREIKRILKSQSQECLYLDNMQAQKDLGHEVRVDERGRIQVEDGPFRKLLRTGGTLLINVSRFSPQQLEAFNTLMEEQVWEGIEAEQPVRIVFLCDADTLQKNVLSGAQISRTAFRDLSEHSFPDCDDPPVMPAQSGHPAHARIIDLEGYPLWQRKVFGGPEINRRQRWEQKPGLLDHDFRYPVVFRNAPDDPYLKDQVAEWRKAGKDVRLEQGGPPEELARRVANKRRATPDDLLLLAQPDASVCVVNALNIDNTLHSYIGVRDNAPALIRSILRIAQARLPEGRLPLVLVGEDLPEPLWDKLMLHREGFCAAAAPGVRVPAKYEQHVATLVQGAPNPFQPVRFFLSADDALANIPDDHSTTHLFVTPAMRANELVSSLERMDGEHTGGAALPPLEVRIHQLARDLRDGKTVVLHGLENNPGLASDLATLLHPPHYLDINGNRYHFGRKGGLNGRILVVTGDPELCRRHGLTPMREHHIGTEEQWKRAIRDKLVSRFHNRYHHAIDKHLPQIFKLFEAMQRQGLIPQKTPLVSYRQVETLVHHLFARSTPSDDPRLFRSFFKDMLIGDHRRTELRQDDRYEQLKFLLRELFPEQMESMPDSRVDIRRLERLLQRVDHPKDIRANVWRFLNCFSRNVAGRIVNAASAGADAAPRAGNDNDVQERTLSLVLDQALHHGLRLSPLLMDEARRRAGQGHMPAARKLRAHMRPPKRDADWKNLAKAELAQTHGNALFFKGPPGAGKTHLTNVLTEGAGSARHVANIADIGTQPYADALETWAKDRPARKPALIVDEANLARDGSHDMLRAMRADGTLFVNGRRNRLSEKHSVIFTGNADSFPGRSPQGVAEIFAKVQFKAMDEPTLRARFVTPLLDHALSQPRIRRAAGLRDYVEEHAASIHATLQRAYPEKNLSPRNLEEYVAQVVCRLRSKKQRMAREALAPWMASLALNVYAGALPAEDGPVLEAWLRHQFGVAPQARLPGMSAVSAKALKAAGLAPTVATRELADSVAWWLKSQQLRDGFSHKEKTLGQKALLIEGPASRGKDGVVKAVLDAKGVGYVHINANPYDMQHLRDALDDARRNGRIVVISEFNLLPSDMLEGEFNALLTGDAPAAPGFGIIATVNPSGYAGRKPLSPALENRMLKKVIGDYPTQELHAIARSLAGKARRRLARGYISLPYGWLAGKTVRELVRRHQELSEALAAYPGEHKPKIRELRETINALSSRQKMRLDEAFESNYAYYLRLANASGGTALNIMRAGEADAEARMKDQLARLLSLARPEWLSQPELAADPTLLIARPIAYDAQTHRLRFSPFASPSRLYAALLALIGEGLQPDASDAPDAMDAPAGNIRGPGSSVQAQEELPRDRPVALRPVVEPSGVGTATLTGRIGTITNDAATGTYLVQTRIALNNSVIPESPARLATSVPENALVTNQDLRLTNIAGTRDDGGGFRVYLPVPHLTRPAHVSVRGRPVDMVFRDEQGGWYVLADRPVVSRVKYRLTAHAEAPVPVWRRRLFSGLNMKSRAGEEMNAIDAILALAAESKGRGREETVGSLKELFADPRYFQYSKQDAEALGLLHDTPSRCQHFLEHGQGVCYEFATTFAAVLEQVFKIPARLCYGYRTQSGDIPRQAHRWVEYCDSEGRWHTVDPTPAAIGAGRTGMAPQRPSRSAAATAAEPESDGGSGGNFHDIYGDDAFHLPPGLLQHFSPAKLGLEYWHIQNDGKRYRAVGNRLVLERLIRGETDMYLDQTASTSAQLRGVVLEDLPAFADEEERRRFLVKMTRPVQAMIDSGVPVFFHNRDGEMERMTSSVALQEWVVPGPDADKVRPDDDTRLAIGKHSAPFLERLASHYYESVLAARGIDPQDRDAVLDCIFDDLAPVLDSDEDEPLPLRITIRGTALDLTLDDLARHWVRRIMNERNTTAQKLNSLFELLSWRDASAITLETDPALNAIDMLLTPEVIRTLSGNQRLMLFKRIFANVAENAPDGIKTWYLRHALAYVRDLRRESGLRNDRLTTAIDTVVASLDEGIVNFDDPEQRDLLLEIFRQFPTKAIDDWRAVEAIGLRFANWLEPNLDAGVGLGREFERVAFGGPPGT